MSVAKRPSIGIYVHFPWCLRKCPYCDFLSIASERPEIPHARYADAVLSELSVRGDIIGPRRLHSIFFGGGTPSLWQPAELGRVLSALRARFPDADAAPEITVECNPTSFDPDRARALMDHGVGRVSIGVQSLDAERLKFLGRLHDPDGGLRAVRDAVAAGVPRVSADLIFGVAGQTPESAADEVRRVAELGVTHLSAYALTIEPGTQFGALARRGKLPLLPDDAVADSFLAVDEALTALGFEHYEISNYAKPGQRSVHNVGYWRGAEYLGLGTGAWGTVVTDRGRLRYRNTQVPERYMAPFPDAPSSAESMPSAPSLPFSAASKPGPPPFDLFVGSDRVSELEPIDDATALSERILLGLRLADGVDLDAEAAELGVPAWTPARQRNAEKLVARGRLERDGGRLRIPKHAWLHADGTIAELI